MCSPDNNNEKCGYDGGDCCWCDCDSPDCEEKGDPSYDCIDPESKCKGEGSLPFTGLMESPRVDSTGVPTPSPAFFSIADDTPGSTFSPTAAAMPAVPVSPGTSQSTDASSDGAPVGPIVGGVAGVLVIVAIILAVAFKTGRFKNCRHSSTDPTPAVPVEPAHHTAGSAASLQQYPSQPSGHPTTQYPVAHQYPAAI
ncbi:unnamed protein product [Ectocarpus fasciculatus]